MSEVMDAEVVEVTGTDLAEAHTAGTLFKTDDPVTVLQEATRTADALAKVLKSRNLTTTIQGKEHVKVEGWQTLGSMLGVTPVCVWTRPLENGWEARVEARTLDGRIVGAAEAMCTRSERMWAKCDDYALRSMAQTRATSKALASPLRFVITLAGYEGTPAEEMTFAESAEEPFTEARLIRAADKLKIADKDRKVIGAWLFDGKDTMREDRLKSAVELLEAGKQGVLKNMIGRS